MTFSTGNIVVADNSPGFRIHFTSTAEVFDCKLAMDKEHEFSQWIVMSIGGIDELLHLLIYRSGEAIFRSDSCRIPSKRMTQYNDKRASRDGRLPDDTWILPSIHKIDAAMERVVRFCSTAGEEVVEYTALDNLFLRDPATRLGRRYTPFKL